MQVLTKRAKFGDRKTKKESEGLYKESELEG